MAEPEVPADKPDDAPASAAPAPAGQEQGQGKSKALWMGTAVGIGSAALVAALLYSNRKK